MVFILFNIFIIIQFYNYFCEPIYQINIFMQEQTNQFFNQQHQNIKILIFQTKLNLFADNRNLYRNRRRKKDSPIQKKALNHFKLHITKSKSPYYDKYFRYPQHKYSVYFPTTYPIYYQDQITILKSDPLQIIKFQKRQEIYDQKHDEVYSQLESCKSLKKSIEKYIGMLDIEKILALRNYLKKRGYQNFKSFYGNIQSRECDEFKKLNFYVLLMKIAQLQNGKFKEQFESVHQRKINNRFYGEIEKKRMLKRQVRKQKLCRFCFIYDCLEHKTDNQRINQNSQLKKKSSSKKKQKQSYNLIQTVQLYQNHRKNNINRQKHLQKISILIKHKINISKNTFHFENYNKSNSSSTTSSLQSEKCQNICYKKYITSFTNYNQAINYFNSIYKYQFYSSNLQKKIDKINQQTFKLLFQKSIQMFSFDPCKISRIIKIFSCSDIFVYFFIFKQIEELFKNKNYSNLIQMMENQQQFDNKNTSILQYQDFNQDNVKNKSLMFQKTLQIHDSKITNKKLKNNQIYFNNKKKKNILNPPNLSYLQNYICKCEQICTNCQCHQQGYCHQQCQCYQTCHYRQNGCQCLDECLNECPCRKKNLQCHPNSCKNCFKTRNKQYLKYLNKCKNNQIILWNKSRINIGKSDVCNGLGAFASKFIKKNQLIGCYIGEYVNNQQLLKLREQKQHLYNYEYRDGGMDAKYIGSKCRFINHTKQKPNTVCQYVYSNGSYYLSFYASRNIQKSEELLVNYDEGQKLSSNFPQFQYLNDDIYD